MPLLSRAQAMMRLGVLQTMTKTEFPQTLKWSLEVTVNSPEELAALLDRMPEDGDWMPDITEEGPATTGNARGAADWEVVGEVVVGHKWKTQTFLIGDGMRRYCQYMKDVISEIWENRKTGQRRTCRKEGPWVEDYCRDVPAFLPPLTPGPETETP